MFSVVYKLTASERKETKLILVGQNKSTKAYGMQSFFPRSNANSVQCTYVNQLWKPTLIHAFTKYPENTGLVIKFHASMRKSNFLPQGHIQMMLGVGTCWVIF